MGLAGATEVEAVLSGEDMFVSSWTTLQATSNPAFRAEKESCFWPDPGGRVPAGLEPDGRARGAAGGRFLAPRLVCFDGPAAQKHGRAGGVVDGPRRSDTIGRKQ